MEPVRCSTLLMRTEKLERRRGRRRRQVCLQIWTGKRTKTPRAWSFIDAEQRAVFARCAGMEVCFTVTGIKGVSYLTVEDAVSLLENFHLRIQLPGRGWGWGWGILLALSVPLHWALCSHCAQISKVNTSRLWLPSLWINLHAKHDPLIAPLASIQRFQSTSATVQLRPGVASIWSDEVWGPANSFRTPPPLQHLPSVVSHAARLAASETVLVEGEQTVREREERGEEDM